VITRRSWQRVDAHLDLVARDVAAQRLLAVLVVELRLQVVAGRLDRVGGDAERLIFSTTAVIASVCSFCASCAVRARLSAAIDTQARSGACFTTPSPSSR
jgi:hypothetical protein